MRRNKVGKSKLLDDAAASTRRIAMLAFELGYKAAECGKDNIQAAMEKFLKTYDGK